MKALSLASLITVSVSLMAFLQPVCVRASETDNITSQRRAANIGPGLEGSLTWGPGNTGQPSGNISSRATQTLALSLFPCAVFDLPTSPLRLKIKAGLLGQYLEARQFADVSDTNGQNILGKSYLLGAGARFQIESYSLFLGYDFLGSYSFPNQTKGYSDISYTSVRGIVAGAAYDFSRSFAIELVLRSNRYFHSSFEDSAGIVSAAELEDAPLIQNSLSFGGKLSL